LTRPWDGPTTPGAPQAWCRPGTLAFDPYCGTGSLLLAAARFGATVVGGDIDIRVLKLGKRNPKTGALEDNFSNFDQYGLPRPAGLLRMDASRLPFRRGLEGVRGAERSAARGLGAAGRAGNQGAGSV
jgi:tRNA (guanine10-N2)-methyltransferase